MMAKDPGKKPPVAQVAPPAQGYTVLDKDGNVVEYANERVEVIMRDMVDAMEKLQHNIGVRFTTPKDTRR